MADSFIGYQRSAMFGGLLMTLGQFILHFQMTGVFFMAWLLSFVEMAFLNQIFRAWWVLYTMKMTQEEIAGFPFFIWV